MKDRAIAHKSWKEGRKATWSSELERLLDTDRGVAAGARVVNVLEVVDAEGDEAAAEDAADEGDTTADGPVGEADLLRRVRRKKS